MLYVEVMVGTMNMICCDECRKLIRWPEDVRAYAHTANQPPHRYEHVSHPIIEGATRLEATQTPLRASGGAAKPTTSSTDTHNSGIPYRNRRGERMQYGRADRLPGNE